MLNLTAIGLLVILCLAVPLARRSGSPAAAAFVTIAAGVLGTQSALLPDGTGLPAGAALAFLAGPLLSGGLAALLCPRGGSA